MIDKLLTINVDMIEKNVTRYYVTCCDKLRRGSMLTGSCKNNFLEKSNLFGTFLSDNLDF